MLSYCFVHTFLFFWLFYIITTLRLQPEKTKKYCESQPLLFLKCSHKNDNTPYSSKPQPLHKPKPTNYLKNTSKTKKTQFGGTSPVPLKLDQHVLHATTRTNACGHCGTRDFHDPLDKSRDPLTKSKCPLVYLEIPNFLADPPDSAMSCDRSANAAIGQSGRAKNQQGAQSNNGSII